MIARLKSFSCAHQLIPHLHSYNGVPNENEVEIGEKGLKRSKRPFNRFRASAKKQKKSSGDFNDLCYNVTFSIAWYVVHIKGWLQ